MDNQNILPKHSMKNDTLHILILNSQISPIVPSSTQKTPQAPRIQSKIKKSSIPIPKVAAVKQTQLKATIPNNESEELPGGLILPPISITANPKTNIRRNKSLERIRGCAYSKYSPKASLSKLNLGIKNKPDRDFSGFTQTKRFQTKVRNGNLSALEIRYKGLEEVELATLKKELPPLPQAKVPKYIQAKRRSSVGRESEKVVIGSSKYFELKPQFTQKLESLRRGRSKEDMVKDIQNMLGSSPKRSRNCSAEMNTFTGSAYGDLNPHVTLSVNNFRQPDSAILPPCNRISIPRSSSIHNERTSVMILKDAFGEFSKRGSGEENRLLGKKMGKHPLIKGGIIKKNLTGKDPYYGEILVNKKLSFKDAQIQKLLTPKKIYIK